MTTAAGKINREEMTATASPLTLGAVLRLPVLQRALPEVLAGHAQLDRQVRWVHVGEVPNIARLLKGNELLLTTGIGVGNRDDRRRTFITGLANRGLAGLAIELGSTFDRVPRAMIAEATKRELPLIALHRMLRFVEVTEAIQREIVNRQFLVLRRADELQQRFNSLMVGGAGIPEVLAVLAQAIANPVVLERTADGVVYHTRHDADDATVLAAWEAVRRGAPSRFPTIEHPISLGDRGRWGALLALGIDSPLDDFARVAVERAVGMVALALLQRYQEESLAARERGDLLTRLLDAGIDDGEAWVQAEMLGFPYQARAMLPLAMVPSRALGPADEASWVVVWRDIRHRLDRIGLPCLLGTPGPNRPILAVVAVREDLQREDAAGLAATIAAQAAAERFHVPDAVVMSVGPQARDWREVRSGLRQAQDAVWAAAHAPTRPWHDVVQPDLDRLLWELRDSAAFAAFARDRLAPLLEHDCTHRSDLTSTLRSYCAHTGRKGDTARALHIERQTLYYRLDRIQSILGIDLGDGDAMLGVHLALRSQAYLTGAA